MTSPRYSLAHHLICFLHSIHSIDNHLLHFWFTGYHFPTSWWVLWWKGLCLSYSQIDCSDQWKVSKYVFMCSVAQSCPALCHTLDCRLPASSVHGSFPNTRVGCSFLLHTSSQPRDQPGVSCISCIAGRFITTEQSGKPWWDITHTISRQAISTLLWFGSAPLELLSLSMRAVHPQGW